MNQHNGIVNGRKEIFMTDAPPSQHEHEFKPCDLYVVQKCWYSGPHVSPTVDYLRLLPVLSDAEQVAYQSAHTYAAGRSPVRTIQLPAGQNAASTYGFVSNGVLFWVRRIQAMVSANASVSTVVDSAHCILTNGVIGGTGNLNSRRGSEDVTGRVFVGPAGYAWALQQTASGQVPKGSTCQWVPIGKPNVENITAEWPDRNTWGVPITSTGQALQQRHGQAKRVTDPKLGQWFDSDYGKEQSSCQSDMMMSGDQASFDFLQQPPAAKRICRPPTTAFPGGFQMGSHGGCQFGTTTSPTAAMTTSNMFMG